jgi:hypothetical protein
LAAVALASVIALGCGDKPAANGHEGHEGHEEAPKKAAKKGAKKGGKAKAAAASAVNNEPAPALLMVQAQFVMDGGKPKPGPAKMTLVRRHGDEWDSEIIEDSDSNVFHKAMAWRDGILTIAGEGALLRHWTKDDNGDWSANTLWEKSWGGKFDRMRDVEIGDLDGDGKDELVIATHDQGVVAVATESDEGWIVAEMDQKPDTFVHEVEIGDVDGDGVKEFYVTPSDRNRASGESQPGGVARYDLKDGAYVRSTVVHWEASHAKEILVADVDGNGKDELYIVREAHTEKNEQGKVVIVDPVAIVRMDLQDDGTWKEVIAATLEDKQCRFLFAGDVDHDGQVELVAAAMKSGLWMLEPNEDLTFENVLIDGKSGGFEHASHAADLDGDGKLEIYVAADNQKELRQYLWNGQSFKRSFIDDIPDAHITWNLQDGVL